MKEAAFLDALEQGDLERARERLNELVNDLPRPKYLHFEALLLQRKGEPAEAMKRLDMALVLHLSDPELWAAKARVLEDMGKTDMAKRAADRACRLSPDNYEHQLLCANILYTLKDFKAAMAQVDKALKLEPRSPPALILKGVLISLLEQDHRAALTNFDSAVEIDPDNGSAWCNRGITLRQIGDRDGAIFSLQKALLLDGNDQVARDTLVSMGAERYIPRAARAPTGSETPLKVGPAAELLKEGGGALPPEEWGVEDAFEEIEEPEAEEVADVEEGTVGRPHRKKGSKQEGPLNERNGSREVPCPRCSISFRPEPDDKGRFKCPSCGLVGRFETG